MPTISVKDGQDEAEGALADAAADVGGAGSVSAKLRRMTTQLGAIETAIDAATDVADKPVGAASAVPVRNTLSTASELVSAANAAQRFVRIQNLDSSISVYWGATSGVTTLNGALIRAGESEYVETTEEVWMIAASGTPEVSITPFING